jgi:hypothetical protein
MHGRFWRPLSAALALLCGLAGRGAADTRACAGCFVGVYDDPQMTRTSGQVSWFAVKPIYLGVQLSPGVALSGLRLLANYPLGFTVLDYLSYVAGAQITPSGDGVRIDWPQCVTGTRLLFRVNVFSIGTVQDAVLQLRDAEGVACGSNGAEVFRIPAGCYVLNPSRSQPACATPVAASSWGAVKELFRPSSFE